LGWARFTKGTEKEEVMKRILIIIGLVGIGILVIGQFPGSEGLKAEVQTVQAGGLKIGFISIQRAVKESEKGKAVIAQLQKEVDQAKAKLDTQKNSLKLLEQEINANKEKWDTATYQSKREEYEAKGKKLQRDAEDYEAYYGKRENELIKPIVQGLDQTIKEIGAKEGYSVIFEIGGGILYINPNL